MTRREDDMPEYLRAVLTQWRRTRIQEVNELSRLLGLPTMRPARKADDGPDRG